jgi:hypothetical protein
LHIFRKRVGEKIVTDEKWGVLKGGFETFRSTATWKMGREMLRNCEVKWSGDLVWNVLSFAYICVAVCRFCAARYLITVAFVSYFIATRLTVYNIPLFFILYFVLYCFIVFVILYYLSIVLCCLFPISTFINVCRPLPPGGNQITVDKLHISCIIYHIKSYHTSYIIRISYIVSHIISYHITSYHISFHLTVFMNVLIHFLV